VTVTKALSVKPSAAGSTSAAYARIAPLLLEPAQTPSDCRRAQRHPSPELPDAQPRVLLERGQDAVIGNVRDRFRSD
jgi:hypothetical protein